MTERQTELPNGIEPSTASVFWANEISEAHIVLDEYIRKDIQRLNRMSFYLAFHGLKYVVLYRIEVPAQVISTDCETCSQRFASKQLATIVLIVAEKLGTFELYLGSIRNRRRLSLQLVLEPPAEY